MVKVRSKTVSLFALLICAALGSGSAARANGANGNGQRDALRSLRRAIAQADAPALTTAQETQLSALVTSYQEALPDESDEALEDARDAFRAAVLAGDLTAAAAQATIIANRTAALTSAKLQAEAQFLSGVLGVLRSGGQLDPLIAEFGSDRILSILGGFGHGRR
jgi:hypothetical protein